MRNTVWMILVAVALSPWACGDDPSTETDAGTDGGADGGDDTGMDGIEVTVMSWNLYMGTDIGPLMNPDSVFEVPGLVADAWDEAQANDFPARAEVIADVIAAADPALIGLQEVSLYRGQSPGDYLDGNAEQAEEVWLDYLEVLMAALGAQELDYIVAAVVEGVDAEVPMQVPNGIDDLRLTDRDAILVRGDVPFSNVEEKTFANNYSVTLADGTPLVVKRGFVALDALFDETVLRFAGTHLEVPSASASVQVAQAGEVIDAMAEDAPPVVVVGDLNSPADGSGTASYGNFLDAGYTDAWLGAGNSENGYTCCYGAFLGDESADPGSRIDFVLGRGVVGYLETYIIGHDVETPDGLHPSDHLGVVAKIVIPDQ